MENNATDNTIVEKSIPDLKDMKFFVPAYQRGYRWTEKEVKDLWDDLCEFDPKSGRYCLQPLIVKYNKGEEYYEVIDGQQRLTTIYLFLKYVREIEGSDEKSFSIKYGTRKNSEEFLKKLSKKDDGSIDTNDSCIDFYYMSSAYKAMHDWAAQKADESKVSEESIIETLNSKIIKTDEKDKNKGKVFFIWYELSKDSDSIEAFTRINIGKIPLTNAERIKALLLNSENFKNLKLKDSKLQNADKRQTEISVSWDKIEQELHRDSFWYFLVNQDERWTGKTHIDMIFELLAKEYKAKNTIDISESDPFFSSLVFERVLKTEPEKEEAVDKIWQHTERKFEQTRAWFEDYNQYHLIGYLLSQNRNVSDIQELIKGKGKRDTLKALREEIEKDFRRCFGKLAKVDLNTALSQLGDLEYGSDTENKKIGRVLLIFNIVKLVCESDKQTRFPFDIYKGENWDIEHINAIANSKNNGSDPPDNRLRNLTLLNPGINRKFEYRDKPFNIKREIIIEHEKKGDFIPLCTKNVFLKYFSTNPKPDEWNDVDKKDYIKAMKETLTAFFTKDDWFDQKIDSKKDDKKRRNKR